MSTITTRAGKGSPLTNTEVDNNFTNLNTDKAELSGATFTGNVKISSSLPVLTLKDSNNGGGGGAEQSIQFQIMDGSVSTYIGTDETTTSHSDLVITNNHASGYVDDAGITDTTSDIVLYPLTHVRIASGDLQMGTTTVISSTRDATLGSLLVSHVPTSAQSGIIYPAVIEANDSSNNNDYVVGDGVGIQFKIGTNDVGSPAEQSQLGASIAAIREASTDAFSNAGLGFFITQDNETLDEALRINSDGDVAFKLGDATFIDDKKAIFGNDGDLEIFSGSGNGVIKGASGAEVQLRSTSKVILQDTTGLTSMVEATAGGSVKLYNDGDLKLEAATAIDLHATTTLKAEGTATETTPQHSQSLRFLASGWDTNHGARDVDWFVRAESTNSAYPEVDLVFYEEDESYNHYKMILRGRGSGASYQDAVAADFYGTVNINENTDGAGGGLTVDGSANFYDTAIITSGANDALDLNITDDVANRNRNAMNLTFDLSGADATTADRTKVGLRINVNSTATGGDTFHEHRVYGIKNDVIISGDSDIVYGQYNLVETQHSAGISSVVYGDYTQVIVDESGSGNTTNAYGTYGYVNVQSSGTGAATTNTYGGYFRSLCTTTQEKNISHMHGIMAEVEIDNSANGVTVTNAYVVRAYYDNDVVSSGDATVLNSYLFQGAYAGALPNNPFGVYISSDVPNYFRGSVDVRGDDGLMVKNTADTHLAVMVQTDLASDYGIMRFYGANAAQVGFLIGYGSTNTTPNELSIKATHAAGAFSVFTNGQRRLRVQNALTTVSTPMVIEAATDVSPTSTAHAFQIGAVGTQNLRFDPNEIMAVNADGSNHDLRLQHSGGKVLVNNDLILEGHKIATNGSTMDFSVDDDTGGANQQFRWSEGGVVRMVLEDNDLYVHDNINAGRKYESGGTNVTFDTTSSHISAYAADIVDGSGTEYRTFIQAYNTTDPDVAVFQAFSKDVMADTGTSAHNEKSTAHLLDNGGRSWSWNSGYAGRVRIGNTSTTTAYRAGDNNFSAYSGTGNAQGHTSYAGFTQIIGRESANGDDVFAVYTGGQYRIEFDADGNGRFDGGADISAADYAEYFEWADGNPNNEDRRGHSVVLNSDGTIRIATASDPVDDIIGIVSVEAAVVGDSAWAAWTGKYERDRFGQTVYEDYDLLCWGPYDEEIKSYKTQTTRQAMIDAGREADIPEDAITVVKQRQKLSADYDPDREYTPRKDRREWQAIGLMGKLPLLVGQPTAPQWRKLFDLNDEVEMWLVR